jgi:hypothetical protein
MSENISHLRVVRPGEPPPRARLTKAASLAVDHAELFALSLDSEQLTADDGLRAAYLLGLAQAHMVTLVAILRAVTT